MKAVVFSRHGGPDVLRVEEVPDPVPAADEVLVRVAACGVGFTDHLSRLGAYGPVVFPAIPGGEAAGRVEQVPSAAGDFRVGDRVFGWARHSYAELVAVPPARLIRMPDTLSAVAAAALPRAAGTAWHALRLLAAVQPGERVLVQGGGSAVGAAAIQLAKWMGAWVAATTGSSWKRDRLAKLGADLALDEGGEDADRSAEILRATADAGVAVILEGVGRRTFRESLRCAAPHARVVTYGAPSGPTVEIDIRTLLFRNIVTYGMRLDDGVIAAMRESFAGEVVPAVVSGALAPIVDRQLPLEAAAEAHRLLAKREVFGRIVLVVDGKAS